MLERVDEAREDWSKTISEKFGKDFGITVR